MFKLDLINKLAVARDQGVYLVGGFLRDVLLGRGPRDVDLVVEGDPLPLAKELAESLSGRCLVLDRERAFYRVAAREGGRQLQYDLEGISPGNLIADLARRDFTVNAMAVPLGHYLSNSYPGGPIIDPLGGLADLALKELRAGSNKIFEDDPVRVLRAFRLALQLGFTVEPNTLMLVAKLQKPLQDCSAERIRDELAGILKHAPSAGLIRVMGSHGLLLEQLIPGLGPLKGLVQGGQHLDDVWEHSLKTLEYFEQLITGGLPAVWEEQITAHLNNMIAGGRTRLPLLKLACLLHDVGKQFCGEHAGKGKYTFYNHHEAGIAVAQEAAARLRLSTREKELLKNMVGLHMDPLFLYLNGPPAPRAIRRFFVRAGAEVPGLLLLSLADITSSRIPAGRDDDARHYQEFIFSLLDKYYGEAQRYVAPPVLLDGADVCKLLGIRPSPKVGQVLDLLADAQVEGVVQTREEAVGFVAKIKNMARGKQG